MADDALNDFASRLAAETARANSAEHCLAIALDAAAAETARAEKAEEALGKNALTFLDFAVALELLGHDTMARAARIAEEATRAALARYDAAKETR